METLIQLKNILFQSNDWLSWSVRILALFFIGFVVYICLPEYLKWKFKKKKISPELEEKENAILEKLKEINEEENVLHGKKKLLRRQIDDIIRQGVALRRMEEGIKIERQEVKKPQKEKTKTPAGKEQDIQQFLKMIDNWLGKLPEKAVDEFSKSRDFKLYKRVLEKYGIK